MIVCYMISIARLEVDTSQQPVMFRNHGFEYEPPSQQ